MTTIAARTLLFSSAAESKHIPVEVRISAPTPSVEMVEFYECFVELAGPVSRQETVFGVDSLQALALGIYSAANFLRMLEQSGTLYFSNLEIYSVEDDMSFMAPPST
jgi:hypothetical protein